MSTIQGVAEAGTTTTTTSRKTTSYRRGAHLIVYAKDFLCRKECHCMLFLTPDNDFAGQEQVILINYN
ncbi:hypothetical protein GIB67_018858 [Kingdonia uniflora]|uniref:Ferredoxin-thioredoxin reductase catalytic chain, chloroplastic n=1 Tax=Kingdonia uniflora TaxID=39325 RepID=A0A7J7NEC9_9MAGN|nr:hypothetical protein GIB67_018858 [Kingdonia uniflora]